MKKIIILSCCLLFTLPVSAQFADDGPNIYISLDKNVYTPEEEIHLTVMFYNPHSYDLNIALYDNSRANEINYKFYFLYIQMQMDPKRSTFLLNLRPLEKSEDLHNTLLRPGESVEVEIPLKSFLQKMNEEYPFEVMRYGLQIHYMYPEEWSHYGYWAGRIKSNVFPIRVSHEAFIKREEAIQIARNKWLNDYQGEGKASFDLKFKYRRREYIVTVNPHSYSYLSADYDARIRLDARTGEIKEVLVGP